MRRSQIVTVMIFGALVLMGSTSVALAQVVDPSSSSRGDSFTQMTSSTTELSMVSTDGTRSSESASRFDLPGSVARMRMLARESLRSFPADGTWLANRNIQFVLRRWFGL